MITLTTRQGQREAVLRVHAPDTTVFHDNTHRPAHKVEPNTLAGQPGIESALHRLFGLEAVSASHHGVEGYRLFVEPLDPTRCPHYPQFQAVRHNGEWVLEWLQP